MWWTSVFTERKSWWFVLSATENKPKCPTKRQRYGVNICKNFNDVQK